VNARGVQLREAWAHRDPENDYLGYRGFDPPHLVAWPLGQHQGHALCGKAITPGRIHLLGVAKEVGVKVCRDCRRAAAPARPAAGRAPVVEMATKRAQRGLW